MLTASINLGGDTWEVEVYYNGDATITFRGGVGCHGTYCGEMLHDFIGPNHVPEQVLSLLEEELSND